MISLQFTKNIESAFAVNEVLKPGTAVKDVFWVEYSDDILANLTAVKAPSDPDICDAVMPVKFDPSPKYAIYPILVFLITNAAKSLLIVILNSPLILLTCSIEKLAVV